MVRKEHLAKDAKETLTLWLWGEYESTWSRHFCNLFDTVFGSKHLSWQCFIRSSIASMLAVSLLYVLLAEVLGLLSPDGRAGVTDETHTIGKMLAIGAFINIVPDYLSLFETRWLLKRFDRVKSFVGQMGVLVADAVLTSGIIWFWMNAVLWLLFDKRTTVIEMLALFSFLSIFFYSTFLTSVWAWI